MILTKERLNTIEDAFLYYTGCQIATCEDIAMKKSKSKSDYKRQKDIAQGMVNFILWSKIDYKDKGSRVDEVIACGGIDNYVKEYEPKND